MAKKPKKKAEEIKGVLPPDFPYGPEIFENESSPEAILRSEAVSEAMDREEVEAIDEMLKGNDEKFNKLKY